MQEPGNQDPKPQPTNAGRLDAIIARLDLMDRAPSGYANSHASNVMDIYARLGHLVVGAVAGTAMVGGAIWSLVQFFTRLVDGE